MSEARSQQVMEHSSLQLEFQLPDGKDILKLHKDVINYFANVICSIHVVPTTFYIIIEIFF